MASVGFYVSERFDPTWGDRWTSFIRFSRLTHLQEVVGLDCNLSPGVLERLIDGDEPHLVFSELIFGVFDSPEYALSRTPLTSSHQLLALQREPSTSDLKAAVPPAFRFMGFELIEDGTQISALTNCGGFPKAFAPSDLSAAGLIDSAERAYLVRDALRREYPDAPHATCSVWALWRWADA